MPAKILILGGTGEARDLARALLDEGFETVTSLAGVTSSPVSPPGEVRTGGFGGAEGLIDYLVKERIAAIADATHVFAARISRHAFDAARAAGIPLMRFEWPAWTPGPGDQWTSVPDIAAAAKALPAGARALVTTGRKELVPFFARHDLGGVARMIEAPDGDVPAHWLVLRARPPFSVEDETRLMAEHSITHLVSKNSGGDAMSAKLVAAREKKIPVVMVERPAKPDVPTIERIADAAPMLQRMLSP